ncbi:MAG: C45 family autoproteolytic acyltransferase/hydrolase [Thermoplasmatota archaeon]
MNSVGSVLRGLVLVCLAASFFFTFPVLSSAEGTPVAGEVDPCGGYITEKEGFLHIQVSGSPDDIGYQHGVLLADLIPRSLSAYAHATERSYGLDWTEVRRHGRTYWRLVPDEQREEIEAIARGSSENGARNPLGDPVDWVDILSLNAIWDIWWRAEPPGNPWWWLPWNSNLPYLNLTTPHHCSAFVATGDATADGGFVMAQSLWMPYFLSPAHAVFIDILPDTGNRIFMEVTAGMIWSGTEWYHNSAGLVIAETTLGTGPYQWGGVPSFVRLRKAVQYADSIDSFRDIMLENTNGAYCGDYLLADTKTNEVAILELGSYKWALKRTSNGFLPSCNYPWDTEVAEEMGAVQGWDHGCYPRWVRWEQLSEEYYGEITVEHGMMFLGDHYDTVEETINPCSHTLCGHVENASGYPHGSLDAKVTNRTLAQRMETFCRFGHSCGQPFIVEDHAREHPEYAFDDLIDIIPRPFATYSPLSDLQIKVLDRKGDPVPGAEINLKSVVDNTTYNATSGNGGIADLSYLPRSDYMITAEKSDLSGELVYGHYTDGGSVDLIMSDRSGGGILSAGSSGSWIIIGAAALLVVAAGVYLYARRGRG